MTVDVAILVSIISVSVAIFFGVKSTKRADMQDVKDDTIKLTQIETKIDMIVTNVFEVKNEISSLRTELNNIKERVTIVEESSKNAHKRLDKLEKEETKHE